MRRGAYRESGPIALSQLDNTIMTNQSEQFNVEASSPRDLNLNYRNINYMEGSAFGSYKAHPSSGIGARSAVQGSGAGAGGESDESPQTANAPSAPSAQPSRTAGPDAGPARVLSFAEVTKTEDDASMDVNVEDDDIQKVIRQLKELEKYRPEPQLETVIISDSDSSVTEHVELFEENYPVPSVTNSSRKDTIHSNIESESTSIPILSEAIDTKPNQT
ncbi:unnamed protein product [Parnassius apollo]|uniref:(apollo) hypothetical protein n=1 Tax=Parnassius apollo TaxID=110799 RepID=A0A8S3Y1T1_PARAO|nr:unnamed protein product [Parnassius apollo]